MTIYLTGDTHGSVGEFKDVINQIDNPTEDDVIIVCGDASLEYGKYDMSSCKKAMAKFPGEWLILRGNHDSRYWRKHTVNIPDGLAPCDGWNFSEDFGEITLYQKKYPNIHYIDDTGGIYTIDGYNILFIPGAYSVDRGYRLVNGLPYEFEEELSLDEFQNLHKLVLANKNNIDFLVAHTYPKSVEPKLEYLFMANVNQSSVSKRTEEWLDIFRNDIGDRLKHTFFGHMHDSKELDEKTTMLYHKIVRLEDYV